MNRAIRSSFFVGLSATVSAQDWFRQDRPFPSFSPDAVAERVLLVDLSWQVTGADDVPASAERAWPDGGWALLHSFPCLRSYLIGHGAAPVELITA